MAAALTDTSESSVTADLIRHVKPEAQVGGTHTLASQAMATNDATTSTALATGGAAEDDTRTTVNPFSDQDNPKFVGPIVCAYIFFKFQSYIRKYIIR